MQVGTVEAQLPREMVEAVWKLVLRAARYWWVVLLTAVVGSGAVFMFARTRHEKFMSEAVVFYQEGMTFNFSPNEAGPSAKRVGLRLRDKILARASLSKLVQETKLARPGLSREKESELVEETRRLINLRVNDGDTFGISFTAESPAQAQAVTQRLTDQLIDENARMRAEQAEMAREFLDAERTRTEETLRAMEIEMARFLAKHPEFAQDQTPGGGAAVRATSRKGEPAASGDTVLSALRREEARLRQQIANPGSAPAAPADPATAAAIRDAETRVTNAKRELADRRARFTEQHPDVRAAAASLREAEDALKRIKDAAEAKTAAADEVVEIEPKAALQSRLLQVQQEIRRRTSGDSPADASATPPGPSDAAQRIVALEAEWSRLNRELAEARDRFQALDTRQFAASITAASLASGRAARIVVIDPPNLPSQPTGTSKKRILLAGVAGAFVLGALLAFALALIDDHVYQRREVDALAIAPVLVEIPRFHESRRRRG